MAKIRISAKDKAEYNKLKNRVKSKVSRTLKNYGINLENEISIPSLSDFQTRKEYNEWKQKASSFTNRNNLKYQFRKNEKGLVYNLAQLNKAKMLNDRQRRIAKEKVKEYKDKPFMRHGQQIGTAGERFGMLKKPKNIGFSVPPKFDINNYYTQYDLNKRIEAMERNASTKSFDNRLSRFRELYLNGIEQMYNGDEEAEEVYRKLAELPPDVLYDLYLKNDELQILFNPSPDKGVIHGVKTVDENDHRDTLFDVEKIIDNYHRGNGEDDVDLLKSFPNR